MSNKRAATQIATQITGLPAFGSYAKADEALDGYVRAQVEIVKLKIHMNDCSMVDVWVIRRREDESWN